MKTALFISPHLDDAAFSCGGTLAKLASENWQTILCTVFTASVSNPQGFALRCQLDKNLPAEIDYMKLRRLEDSRAAKILNAAELLHLDFLEAPHREYESASELFAGIKENDQIWQLIAERFDVIGKTYCPELIFAPQGLGNHVDHLQTIRATLNSFASDNLIWYQDTPYVIRTPDAQKSELLAAAELSETFCEIDLYLEQKIAACAAYKSQINFQFGGFAKLKESLQTFHQEKAKHLKNCSTVELFLTANAFCKTSQLN